MANRYLTSIKIEDKPVIKIYEADSFTDAYEKIAEDHNRFMFKYIRKMDDPTNYIFTAASKYRGNYQKK